MPDATITSTASTFGSISGTFAADQSTVAGTVYAITGTVNGSVGVPGPQGPAGSQGPQGDPGSPGAPGQGVAAGGSAGQVLQKLSATSYDTGWLTLPADYITSVTAPLAVASGVLSVDLSTYLLKAGGYITGDIQSSNNSAYRSWDGAYNSTVLKGDYLQLTNSNIGGNALTVEWNGITFPSGKQTVHYPGAGILSGYATESWVTAGFYPLTGNPSGFITSSALSPYLLSATAASTYAVIAAGQPTSGTVGQVLTKNSGTNYDSSWQTLIPGDRYLTSSTTSLTIDNDNKTLTVGTGLSYTPQQDVVIAYDASNHMHAQVLTYDSGTGVMTVDVQTHTGTGTFAAWTVNVGGTVPVSSIVWGDITGTLGDQTDLATALNAKLEITDAASTYYLQTNPAGFITASALTPYLPLAGGAMTGSITSSSATYDTEMAGDLFGVQLSADHTKGSVLQFNGLDTYDGASHMLVTPTGLTFPDASVQTTAYTGGGGYITSVTAPLAVTSGDLSIDLSTYETVSNAAATYLSIVDAATGYYPLSNPSGFITSAALTGYATESFVTSQGYITSSALTGYAQLAGATFTGEIVTAASTTATAGLTLPHGTAPTTPVNGEIWTTTGGLFARINAGTQQFAALSTNNTFSNASSTYGSSTATGTIGLATGATISASTKTVNVATGGVVGSTTTTTIGPVLGASTTSIGNTTAASTLNLATGATLAATTKAVNIATNAVAGATTTVVIGSTTGTSGITLQGQVTASGTILDLGSSSAASNYGFAAGATTTGNTKTVNIATGALAGATTTIAIGSTTGTSTTTLQGTTNGITAAADTNSVALATTAYVVGQAGSATPVVDGTAAVGTSLRYARQDHVHPTDTSRAALASPTFTGTPLSTTAAADTNTTQIATTAYVVGQASSTAPVIDGTATVGTSLKYARADHVHPTDTSRAALNSPAFTGTPSLPTGTTAVTQTVGNNTTAVATTAFVLANAGSTSFASTAQVVSATSTTTALAPSNQGFLLTNPRLQTLAFINQSAVSGSGANTTSTPQNFSRQVYLSSLAVGRSAFLFGAIGSANAGFGSSTTKADQVDFSKKVWISGYACMGYGGGTSYLGDANTICRITLGGYSTNTTGDMTLKGIGLKKVGGVSSFVTLTVHNGTTLTDVASTVAIADGAGIQWQIYSDGTGNVTLYINGTQAATTTAGPTTATASGSACYREQVEAVATPGVRQVMNCNGGWFYTE